MSEGEREGGGGKDLLGGLGHNIRSHIYIFSACVYETSTICSSCVPFFLASRFLCGLSYLVVFSYPVR